MTAGQVGRKSTAGPEAATTTLPPPASAPMSGDGAPTAAPSGLARLGPYAAAAAASATGSFASRSTMRSVMRAAASMTSGSRFAGTSSRVW